MPVSTPPESFAFRVGRLLAQDADQAKQTGPQSIPIGIVNLVLIVKVSDKEVVEEHIVGARVIETNFEEASGEFTLKAVVPNPRLLMPEEKFQWIQKTVRIDGATRNERYVDVQRLRGEKK